MRKVLWGWGCFYLCGWRLGRDDKILRGWEDQFLPAWMRGDWEILQEQDGFGKISWVWHADAVQFLFCYFTGTWRDGYATGNLHLFWNIVIAQLAHLQLISFTNHKVCPMNINANARNLRLQNTLELLHTTMYIPWVRQQCLASLKTMHTLILAYYKAYTIYKKYGNTFCGNWQIVMGRLQNLQQNIYKAEASCNFLLLNKWFILFSATQT